MNTRSLRHWFRDIFVWKMSIFGIAYVYRMLWCRAPRVRVVVFHDVPDTVWFESMIETLTESFHIVTPQEFHHRQFVDDSINVLITFDDGYASWQYVALPILDAHDVKALFFVNSGLVDAAHDRAASDVFMTEQLRIAPRAPLTWEGVTALVRGGHTIGGHTRMHCDLATLTRAELERELEADKQVLETRVGISITDFAYPFGTEKHVAPDMEPAILHAGYVRAYTAISRFVRNGNLLHIPRTCIETGLTPRMLKRWVYGAYDLFDIVKQLCVR